MSDFTKFKSKFDNIQSYMQLDTDLSVLSVEFKHTHVLFLISVFLARYQVVRQVACEERIHYPSLSDVRPNHFWLLRNKSNSLTLGTFSKEFKLTILQLLQII